MYVYIHTYDPKHLLPLCTGGARTGCLEEEVDSGLEEVGGFEMRAAFPSGTGAEDLDDKEEDRLTNLCRTCDVADDAFLSPRCVSVVRNYTYLVALQRCACK